MLLKYSKIIIWILQNLQGRSQTTQGIWLATSSTNGKDSILVFDVEGVDSRERGDSHEVTPIYSILSWRGEEIWTQNFIIFLGSFQHPHREYLASWCREIQCWKYWIIEKCLWVELTTLCKTRVWKFTTDATNFNRWSNSGPKTIILFVIRDHLAKMTPLEKLKQTILKDMYGIWDSIIKVA